MNLTLFKYKETDVRVVEENGEPWFVATDLCKILGLTPSAYKRLDEDEKGWKSIPTLGGNQKMVVVNEPGLNTLVIRCRKTEAKPLIRWLTHEVIPSIRKTGSYSIEKPPTTREVAQSMTSSTIVQQLEILIQVAKNQEQLKFEQQAQKEELAEVKQIALETKEKVEKPETIEVTHFSVIGWSRLQNAKVPDKSFAAQIGKKLKPLCDMKKLELKKQANHEYGYIWLYPREILESHFLPFYEEIQAKRLAKEKSVC